MNTFMIADMHFGSESIIKYENRPFETVDQMDKALIQNWNDVVKETDIVYVLGDFSIYQKDEKNTEILRQLTGKKILIMGNHDTYYSPDQWRMLGFAECSQWPVLYHDFNILSHEPVYLNSNMPYANIYGHVHGNASYKSVSPQSACVSVERIEYTPIDFNLLKSMMLNCKTRNG